MAGLLFVAVAMPVAPAAAATAISTSTTVTVPASPVAWHTPIELSAVVSPDPGPGWINFFVDGSNLLNGALENGVASATLPFGLYPTTHEIYARFVGNTTHAASDSPVKTITVPDDRAIVTVAFSTSPNPALRRDPVALHAVITPNPGSGTVTFHEGPYSLTTAPVAADGTVDTQHGFTTSGTHTVIACFNGNDDYQGDDCSPAVEQVVTSLSSTTTLTIEPGTIYPEDEVTIGVTVAPPPETATLATVGVSPFHTFVFVPIDIVTGHGEVTVTNGTTYGPFPIGTTNLRAYFPGTNHVDASTSDVVPLIVRLDDSGLVPSVTPGSPEVGDELTFHASVTTLPGVESAAVGFLVTGPPESGFGESVAVELGLDGAGEASIDTDHWPAGEYWYDAYCCGDPHLAPVVVRGGFTLIDDDPPVGTLVIAGDDVVVSNWIVVGIKAGDGIGSGVRVVALSNDGVTWTESNYYAEGMMWTLAPGDGVRTVYAKWRDQAGNWSNVESASVTVDSGAGYVSTPDAAVLGSTTLTASQVATRIGWSGATDAGPVGYRVERSRDGGSYGLVQAGVTSTSLVASLAPGHSYRFRVRAVGQASDAGAWAYGSTFRLTAVSQSSSAVRYRGSWVTSTSTVWWGGTARSSSTKGSTATYTFTGRKIAWVGLKGANRGKAQVFVNGVLKATVDLYSATTLKQRIVWSANYSTSATRTITIKVLATPGRPRVDIDGFIVGS
jgi:hypothetical protein